ncbi:MAG: hypothetical protein C4539_20345 [Ignavibacteriales bacterium]|nr:MAG: hypothetical protein C4539_20345 [Ignavibacteriales bacterium]
MTKFIFIIVCFLFLSGIIHSQSKVSLSAGYGNYLSNSENSTRIMGDKKFRSHFVSELSYQNENLLGLNLMIDFNYHEVTKKNVVEFLPTGEDGSEIVDSYGIDLSLVSFNFDLSYVRTMSDNFSIGLGPSFCIINRIVDMDEGIVTIGNISGLLSFYDKLASSGLGANGFIMFNMPIMVDSKFFITSKLKFRYIHSIWFDKGIRNLDNYKQEFITAQITLGIGYKF